MKKSLININELVIKWCILGDRKENIFNIFFTVERITLTM